jgi:mannosyltransferase
MLWNIGAPSLWQDEVATITAANRPWPAIVNLVKHVDAVHGIFYFFMHIWGAIAGFSPFAMRAPSAIFVGISILLIFRLTEKLGYNKKVATYSAIIFMLLPKTFVMSSEARSPALVTTLSIIMSIAFLNALDSKTRFKPWSFFVLLSILSIYVFAFIGLMLLVFAIYIAISRRDKIFSFWLSLLLIIAFATPLLATITIQEEQVAWIQKESLWVYLAKMFISVPFGVGSWFSITVVLVAMGMYPHTNILLWIWCIFPGFALIALTYLAHPIFVSRYLIFTTPAFAILAAIGLSKIHWLRLKTPFSELTSRDFVVITLLVALAIPSALSSRAIAAKGTEWASIANEIQKMSLTGDAILVPNGINAEAKQLNLIPLGYQVALNGLVDLTLDKSPTVDNSLFGHRMLQSQVADVHLVKCSQYLSQSRRARLKSLSQNG